MHNSRRLVLAEEEQAGGRRKGDEEELSGEGGRQEVVWQGELEAQDGDGRGPTPMLGLVTGH